LLTTTSLQKYGHRWSAGFSTVRIVCRNTFHDAEGDLQVKFTHIEDFDPKLITDRIERIAAEWIGFKGKVEYLGKHKLTSSKAIVQYFQKLFPPGADVKDKNQLSGGTKLAIEAMKKQPGAGTREGSWYQAFNAVTYVTDHRLMFSNGLNTNLVNQDDEKSRRRMEELKDKMTLAAQYGAGTRRKVKALKLAMDMAGKSPVLA
jgi:hypothetical protein